jgi:hypothetical protein
MVVNLVILKGADSVAYHLKRQGPDCVEVACSETVDTSRPPAFITGCLPCDPQLGLFENEVSTFLRFQISCLSQRNLSLKPSVA